MVFRNRASPFTSVYGPVRQGNILKGHDPEFRRKHGRAPRRYGPNLEGEGFDIGDV